MFLRVLFLGFRLDFLCMLRGASRFFDICNITYKKKKKKKCRQINSYVMVFLYLFAVYGSG